jgi:hypothetical protein
MVENPAFVEELKQKIMSAGVVPPLASPGEAASDDAE